MFLYQLKIVVAEKKLDEFIDSLRFLSNEIREEQGCLDFSLYRDLEKKNVYQRSWKMEDAPGHGRSFQARKIPSVNGCSQGTW